MKLLEYEAKDLLSQSGILVPLSSLIYKSGESPLQFPVVLKSQVPVGGRGKLGGVEIITEPSEMADAVDALLVLDIKGHVPNVILAEEKLDIAHEHYVSFVVDRSSAVIQLIAHKNGGVEVENNTDKFLKLDFDIEEVEAIAQKVAVLFGHTDELSATLLQYLFADLYECFTENDATLLEINPLVYTPEKTFVAGDCKMELDDNAAFRHEWNFEQKPAETNFVTLDKNGTIATIANGAGLAMATVDAVADSGMAPANFLDIGGGANTESLLAAFNRIMTFPHIQGIVINIFAGITRCDEVARAIIAARQQIENLPPLYIRLAGTNYEEASELLLFEDIPMLITLEECIAEAKEATKS